MNNPLRFLATMLALGSPDKFDELDNRRFNSAVKRPKTPAQMRRRRKGIAGRKHRKLVRRMERARA